MVGTHMQPLADLESATTLRLRSRGHRRPPHHHSLSVLVLFAWPAFLPELFLWHPLPSLLLPLRGAPSFQAHAWFSSVIYPHDFVCPLLALTAESTPLFSIHLRSSESHNSNCPLDIPTWLILTISDPLDQS